MSKICPFMTRPIIVDSVTNDVFTQNNWELFKTYCIGEECEAWGRHIRKTLNSYGKPVYEYCTGCRLIS